MQLEYDAYNFIAVTQLVLNFLATDLSSFYFETVKVRLAECHNRHPLLMAEQDRLYADAVDSLSRRSACTVLQQVLHSLRLAVAPMVPHLAEVALAC